MKKLLFFILFPLVIFSQENDLLSQIDTIDSNKTVQSAFKALKIVNLESTKLAAKGDFYLMIAHRFGYVENGFEDFFGIDNANTQIKFLYGVNEWMTLQIARSGFQKTYEVGGKFSLKQQETDGFPVAIVGFTSVAVNTEFKESDYPNITFENRLSYVTQALISRKFSEKLSLQLSPTYFHENTLRDTYNKEGEIILPNPQDNSQFAIGMGGRYKFAKRWSVNIDYAAHLNRASESIYKNPLAIGFDLETGGHVFQMLFTNAQAINEAGFLGQTSGDWSKGEIAFGFNLYRVF
ncbi:DUF5777 family beta-barrel protein [Flavobacterium sp.]|jgi:hypothetical protein|uniref:DUF5777 family beta-barrel protein n=1 Tax=Flavobacterium sp. TaxID=239 RepID=UPI0037C15718